MGVDVRITPEMELVFCDPALRKVIKKGRRVGATHNWILLMVIDGLNNKKYQLWGDTINSNIDKYFQRFLLPFLNKLPSTYWKWNYQKKELRTINALINDVNSPDASIIDFRSCDNPENWEGFGYNRIFLNEAGIILRNRYLYENAVLPMLLDYPDAELIAAGVPKGKHLKNGEKHPFYEMSEDPKTKTWTFTSYDSPVARKEDIDELVAKYGGPNSPTAQQEIFGEFIDAVSSPFLFQFLETKHVCPVEFDERLNLYTCWDFNVESTCLLIQYWKSDVKVLKEYHQRDIVDICRQIKEEFPSRRMYVNGDASGNSENASNETYYDLVRKGLNLGFEQFRVPSANPSHKNSYLASNEAFKRLNIQIDPSCEGLILDCKLVEILEGKGKIEIDKSDPQRTHHLDPLRYHIWMEHIDNLNIRE